MLILLAIIASSFCVSHLNNYFVYAYPTMEVNIEITNVRNLYGVDLTICYTTEYLDLINAVPKPPWENHFVIYNEISESEGMYRLVMVGSHPSIPFTGNTILASLTFSQIYPGEYNIWLTQVKLADVKGNSLSYKVEGCTIQGTEPLIVSEHYIAVVSIFGYPRSVYQGDYIYVSVVVENRGNFPETFEVIVYADQAIDIVGDEIIVGVKSVSDLPVGGIEIVGFIWDTAGVPYGSYYLSAKADNILGEVYIKDNFLRAGEYIGGVYPKPHLRQMFNIINEASFSALWVGFIVIILLKVKKYWCL